MCKCVCVCVCMCVSVRERVCVCERERESESACELCVSVGEELLILNTKVSPFTTEKSKSISVHVTVLHVGEIYSLTCSLTHLAKKTA